MPNMLSIIIPTYQRTDLLRRCLVAVQQHRPTTSEVIVVDDHSPTAAVQRLAAEFGVRHERLAVRSGFARAANQGIRCSRGDIVELLNDDTEVQPGWAEPALAWFADETVGAVAPLVLDRDGDSIDSAGDRYYLGGVAAKRGHGERLHNRYLAATQVFGASASSAFYRRSALDRVGLFPESFGSYFEDVDLAFRLQRARYQTVFEPRSRVLHVGSASFGRTSRQLLQQQSRNEERVFWRNLPGRWLWRALPCHLGVLAAKAWRRWDEGTLVPFLCGRLQVLTEMGELVRYRRGHGAATHDPRGWQVEEKYWSER